MLALITDELAMVTRWSHHRLIRRAFPCLQLHGLQLLLQLSVLFLCNIVTHDFGHHDDVFIMVYSGSSLELSLEKSYFLLLPKISFLRKVRRLPIHLPVRMYDSHRLP